MPSPAQTPQPPTAAIIVAAGAGERAGAGLPKQFRQLGDATVVARSIAALAAHPAVTQIQVVIGAGQESLYSASIATLPASIRQRLLPPVTGAADRQGSVANGLEALANLAPPPDFVLIHDAARPFADVALIDRVLGALARAPGAVPALAVTDTLKAGALGGPITGTVPREGLYRVQTPQGFHFAAIRDAHAKAAGQVLTDDAAVLESQGGQVLLVEGSAMNEKLTTAEDFIRAAKLLGETRMGQGFDVHAFAPGSFVTLCGIEIPHPFRLDGHSDADVALHALTDALLGAIGESDIGSHFPPGDDTWKGAASRIFVEKAVELIAQRGGRIVNVDLTIICEAPKVAPHRAAMVANVAALLGIEQGRVAVKATTTEGLGFTGRREGIAAQAIATVRL